MHGVECHTLVPKLQTQSQNSLAFSTSPIYIIRTWELRQLQVMTRILNHTALVEQDPELDMVPAPLQWQIVRCLVTCLEWTTHVHIFCSYYGHFEKYRLCSQAVWSDSREKALQLFKSWLQKAFFSWPLNLLHTWKPCCMYLLLPN